MKPPTSLLQQKPCNSDGEARITAGTTPDGAAPAGTGAASVAGAASAGAVRSGGTDGDGPAPVQSPVRRGPSDREFQAARGRAARDLNVRYRSLRRFDDLYAGGRSLTGNGVVAW